MRLQHLPISPSPPHPDSGHLLELEGKPLPRNSYVKIDQVRVCSIRALRRHGFRRLTARSYDLVMSHAPTRPSTADLSDVVRKQPGRVPRRLNPAAPSRVQSIPRSLVPAGSFLRSHSCLPSDIHAASASVVSHQPLHHHSMPTRQGQSHQHQIAAITRSSESRYGTFSAQDHTLRLPTQRPRRPSGSPPANPALSYLEICIVLMFVAVVGAGLYAVFALGRYLSRLMPGWTQGWLG